MRNITRLHNAALSPYIRGHTDRELINQIGLATAGVSSSRVCVLGADKCRYEAPYATANHSLYDVSLRQLARLMKRHKTHTIRAFMHFPCQALVCKKYHDVKNQCWFEVYTPFAMKGITGGRRRIRFGYDNDTSFLYDHDYKTWMSYLTVGGFDTPYDFGVLIEKAKHHGTSFELKITRTTLSGWVWQNISVGLVDVVQVPDIYAYAEQHFGESAQLPTLTCDREKVQRLYLYILARSPKERTPQHALSYARSLVRKIKIGEEVIEERWEVDVVELPRIVLSVFVLAEMAGARTDIIVTRTRKEIERLTSNPKWYEKLFKRGTIVQRIVTSIRDYVNTPGIFNCHEDLPIFSGSGWSALAKAAFSFHSDIMTKDFINCDGILEEVDMSTNTGEHMDMVVEEASSEEEDEMPQTPLKPVAPKRTKKNVVKCKTCGGAVIAGGLHNGFWFCNFCTYREDACTCVRVQGTNVIMGGPRPPGVLKGLGPSHVLPTAPPPPTVVVASPTPATHATTPPVAPVTTPTVTTQATVHVAATPAVAPAIVRHQSLDRSKRRVRTGSVGTECGTINFMDTVSVMKIDANPQVNSKTVIIPDKKIVYAGEGLEDFESWDDTMPVVLPTGWDAPELMDNHPEWPHVSCNSPGILSNFYPHKMTVKWKGIPREFHCVEQAYQYIKATHHDKAISAARILDARSAKEARAARVADSPGWLKVRVAIMYNLLELRYNCDGTFRAGLTPETQYVHAHGAFWGGTENVFGRLLMTVAENHRIVAQTTSRLRAPYPSPPSFLDQFDAKHEHNLFIIELQKADTDKTANALRVKLNALRRSLVDHGEPKKIHKMDALMGVPGSGKSRSALAGAEKRGPCLFVVPTNKLKEQYASKIAAKDFVYTQHSGLQKLMDGDIEVEHIYIDEASMLPMIMLVHYAEFAPTTLMGDWYQIGMVDFSRTWGPLSAPVKYAKIIPTTWLNTTSRMPRDICDMPLIKRCYPDIKTISTVHESFQTVSQKFKKKGAQLLVLTQDKKLQFKAEGAMTVHEAQGATFENVIFHIGSTAGERYLLANSPNHIVTALTRHTDNIFVREEQAGLLVTAMQTAKIDQITKDSYLATPSFNDNTLRTFNAKPDLAAEGTKYAPAAVTGEMAAEILDKVLPYGGDIEEYQTVVKTNIPFKGGANTEVQAERLHEDVTNVKKHTVYRFPVAQRVRISDSSHKVQGIQTLFGRYTKRTKNLPPEEARVEADRLVRTIGEWVELSAEEGWAEEVFAEAIEKFQGKGHDLTELETKDGWDDMNDKLVKYLLKAQQKPDLSRNVIHRDKDGQGIAAWSKTLNFTMIVWTRLLEKVLMCKAKRGFHFICKYTDEEVLALLDKISVEAAEENLEFFEGDWTEWDSSLNSTEHLFFCKLLKKIGCPDVLWKQYYDMMCKRTVISDTATVVVKNKKDSGRVDTLVGNTAYNAAVILSFFDKKSIKHAMFKGDDSLLVGKRMQMNIPRVEYYEKDAGMKLKPALHRSGEFVSFLVNYEGAAVNLPRVVGKITGRTYANEDEYDKYRLATRTTCPIFSTRHAARTAAVNAVHWKSTEEDMDALLSFVSRFIRGQEKWKNMVSFEKCTKDSK